MAFIKTIGSEEATGKLKRIYDKVQGPNGHIDHVLTIHSLRPHTLTGHMSLYKSVLHHSGNSLPKWYLETIGTYISKLNKCDYCATHHAIGLKRNLSNDDKFQLIMEAMDSEDFSKVLNVREQAGLVHAVQLTVDHANITSADIDSLRTLGFSDGEILEINQVTSYFNYVNRMVVGLGVSLETDNLGLSPSSDDSDDWSHK